MNNVSSLRSEVLKCSKNLPATCSKSILHYSTQTTIAATVFACCQASTSSHTCHKLYPTRVTAPTDYLNIEIQQQKNEKYNSKKMKNKQKKK